MNTTSPTSTYPFSRQDLIPLHDSLLWKIERGAVRTITWREDGEMLTLGI